MGLAGKIVQRFSDPCFYRKRFRDLIRPLRRFDDSPFELNSEDLEGVQKALFVVAHPDDETFCSGLMLALKNAGTHLTVVCLTRGEGGPTGGAKREEVGDIREAEMKRSCETLGVDELIFLEHVDPIGGAYRVYAPDVSVADLAEELKGYARSSDVVVSHGSCGEYWHPAHLLVHAAVREIINGKTAGTPGWITFLARDKDLAMPHLVNFDDEATFRFDASPFHAKRLEALSHHQSQAGLFRRFAGGTSEDFMTCLSKESYCLQAGAFPPVRDRGTD